MFGGGFGVKEFVFKSFFLGRELKDLCHQRVVPQGKKLQGREGKGLWVILSPGIRGMHAVDKELRIVC